MRNIAPTAIWDVHTRSTSEQADGSAAIAVVLHRHDLNVPDRVDLSTSGGCSA
jgi:hypothetical protein